MIVHFIYVNFTKEIILKQLFAEGEDIIGKHSPRQSRGEYLP